MKLHKKIISAFGFILLSASTICSANNTLSDEFFVSNNTKEINVQAAYQRLNGKEQDDLRDNLISVLQKNHIEQGKLVDILGAYQMSSDQNITADNSELFITSPNQHLSNKIIFATAKALAIKLNQESVAVFIPNQSSLGEIDVHFISYQPKISEVIDLIRKNLSPTYSQAFSLHLTNKGCEFKNAQVEEIEWLGSKLNLSDLKKVFPGEEITPAFGKVFLVYQNGKIEQL